MIVPEQAVDAQSLIAFADLVVSAGGTMNREAAALGVPVYTTYGGRLGGVDEELIRDGRLRPLTDPRALELEKRERGARRPRAPRPAADARLLLSALRLRRSRRRRELVAVALELRRADAADLRELAERLRPRRRDRVQHASWKTTYGGTSSAFARSSRHSRSALAVRRPQLGLRRLRRAATARDAELGEERDRLPDHVSQSSASRASCPT